MAAINVQNQLINRLLAQNQIFENTITTLKDHIIQQDEVKKPLKMSEAVTGPADCGMLMELLAGR